MRATPRLAAWLDRSVANRLTLTSVATAVALVLLVGVTAFPLFFYQAWLTFQARSTHSFERISDTFALRLNATRQSLEQLASNSFVINSFVDSSGREVYLQPTLRDFQPPFGVATRLVLFDANLAAFAGNRSDYPSLARQVEALARNALDAKSARMAATSISGQRVLVLALPIYYPPASAHEGVLVSVINSDQLAELPPGLLGVDDCLVVATRSEPPLDITNCDARVRRNRLVQPVLPDDALTRSIGLSLVFAADARPLYRELAIVLGLYLLFGGAAVTATLLFSRRAGRQFAQQLEAVSTASQTLVSNPTAATRVVWDRPDEIGRLAQSFNTMVGTLQGLQASLEQRVSARTAELAEARDKADAANVAKSQFLATMSHEIRTPMNGVLGMAQLLLRPGLTEPQRLHYARTILESGQILLTLLNDVLDLSKVEAGRLDLTLSSVSPREIVDEAAMLFAESARQRGLALTTLWRGTPDEHYVVDAVRLRQMLSNLISNAIKFTEHGQIRVEASEVERDGDNAVLLFSVSDSGIGINSNKLATLFQPFTQVDSSATRKYGGTGLGLSIVRSLAALMGGEAGVQSTAGQGSRFWFRIPARRAAPATARAVGAPSAVSRPVGVRSDKPRTPRVLVAEDNEVNRLVLHAMLVNLGCQVECVDNGLQAVDAIAAGAAPDLLLMDCQMPVLDGLEATACIRRWEAERGRSPLPIVALSASAFEDDRRRCFNAGMDGFLAKPIDLAQLQSVLDTTHVA